jgi:PTS system mannose-specific IIA component
MSMIGLVIVTHGRLADEFVAALEHVVGPQKLIETVCIGPDDLMDHRRQDILDAVTRADTGGGAIVLTDMFGGTPSNLAISILKEANIEVIAGVNLPLLVKLAGVRKTEDLQTAVNEAYAAGRKYIKLASELLDDLAG